MSGIGQKQFKQGKYNPINKSKYIEKGSPIYRSGWELKCFLTLDKNPAVIKWGSENIILPYVDPTRNHTVHQYVVDLFFEAYDPNGNIVRYLVEVKPFKETQPPKISARKKQETIAYETITYARNCAKWQSAIKFARSKGWKFLIWTEKQLIIK